ncbi:tail protein [Ligilactobacillus salitolerans]|uniref:Tail protein n=1 Tax=Ligilactobacillus salitolerans TaxID=1808352 RepID=A0A401IUI7_9LACO|nr:phage tail tube assembly chaperone [Ligilactobacillus salitolerans]GBG95189.1 tail protein [Ligilactobacillus salitolerans]
MVEIYIKQFKKKFAVKASNRNMTKTYDFQLALAKSQDIDNQDGIAVIKLSKEATQTTVQYIKDVLKLTDKQFETLEDMEFTETVELANYISMRLMGMSDEDIKKANEESSGEE